MGNENVTFIDVSHLLEGKNKGEFGNFQIPLSLPD